MTSLVLTVRETLRYRGAIGQWSWVLHRLTGVGVAIFLALHVVDTSWAVFYPDLYVKAIAAYQSPIFTIGEFGLVFAVVYHAFNGLRIIYFDWNPRMWRHQARAAVLVLVLTCLLLLPVFLGMLRHVIDFYVHESAIASDRMLDVVVFSILEQLPFIAGFVAVLAVSIVLAAAYSLVRGDSGAGSRQLASSPIEKFWWSFMRVSGIAIVPLVFGHLALMHVIQGVFDITAAQNVAGTLAVNGEIGGVPSAVEFVYHRWSYAAGGVFIWRVYDLFLLVLVVLHGFNGLRYVLTDYTSGHDFARRTAVAFCTVVAAVLLALGAAALFVPLEENIIEEAMLATAEVYELRGEELPAELQAYLDEHEQ
ncbi:MAG: succinate dehydrogenase, cytochrome b556 subunit [Chloroflexi bacterium]|nr:succinate dehydrogenase, cytochrome b556 subunit [Chloroflexota bacterium]MCY3583703.1 succinate dehydrogenase, cytochrome b556 subunit [Chloroflexota bacterium]MCY3717865.1 succinate dehydrogenase, cytochrome b556 subunit [Chloroflexota bacterium]MDE2649779.1 succinate dehydrogenase, cytochrome b556 subunit [Chloroflexota bacterium]MXX82516.1 succinate dehydrogenase, cytochrome b556 subunit [Chloroflexota bacterium]